MIQKGTIKSHAERLCKVCVQKAYPKIDQHKRQNKKLRAFGELRLVPPLLARCLKVTAGDSKVPPGPRSTNYDEQ
jgi:hypothetical protein